MCGEIPILDGERKLSLSLSPRCNYSGAGEEIGEIPQQGCALSRSFFARIIPEGEGERFSGRVNMVRVNEPRSFTPSLDYLRVDFIKITRSYRCSRYDIHVVCR